MTELEHINEKIRYLEPSYQTLEYWKQCRQRREETIMKYIRECFPRLERRMQSKYNITTEYRKYGLEIEVLNTLIYGTYHENISRKDLLKCRSSTHMSFEMLIELENLAESIYNETKEKAGYEHILVYKHEKEKIVDGMRDDMKKIVYEDLCSICLDNRPNVVVLPCRHMFSCSICIVEIKLVPYVEETSKKSFRYLGFNSLEN